METLRRIKDDWATVKRDPKWIEFKSELTDRSEFTGAKLIIFTEFADTASYLADQIRKEVEPKTLLFSSASSKELRSEVISNFDPNVKEQKDDYRILITTDRTHYSTSILTKM